MALLRLLYIVACDTVIVDAMTHLPTAVNMFEHISLRLPPTAPANFLLPKNWSVITLWTLDDRSVPKPTMFEQLVNVTSPDGHVIFEAKTEFPVSDEHNNYRNVNEFQGFPVSVDGILKVNVSLKEKGKKEVLANVFYPIWVERIVREESNADQDNVEG